MTGSSCTKTNVWVARHEWRLYRWTFNV